MSSKVAKTLLNQIIKKTKYNNVIKYEEKCTNIYILSANMDDDKLIEKSIINQYCNINNTNTTNTNTNTNLQIKQTEIEKTNNCCKFKCCKALDN